MRCFEIYTITDFEAVLREDNEIVFGERNNQYQDGHGHGLIFGSIYNNPQGGGEGDGFHFGEGNKVYPYELIQYWR